MFLCSFSTIISYIDDQFERYLHDESGLNRRHIVDNRVHCCFYFISPLGHGYVRYIHTQSNPELKKSCLAHWNALINIFCFNRLKPLDVQFMKAIHNKVNVVPVIAKADTLTLRERERLKRRVRNWSIFLLGYFSIQYDIPTTNVLQHCYDQCIFLRGDGDKWGMSNHHWNLTYTPLWLGNDNLRMYVSHKAW